MNDKVQVAEYVGSIVAVSNVVTVGCHDVITYHNDNGRTGWNPNENTLTPANVKPGEFGLIATAKLDDDNDQVDGQPLIVTNQNIEGMGVHSVVYLATENDNVYAIDSFTGARLKKVNLGTPVPRPLNCENNGNAVGVNSTPTIDRKAGELYVIAYVMDGVTPIHQLHMLDLSTLQDKIPPVTVTATNTQTDGSTYTFDFLRAEATAGPIAGERQHLCRFRRILRLQGFAVSRMGIGLKSGDVGAARKHPAAQQDGGDIHFRLLLPRPVDQQPSLLPGFHLDVRVRSRNGLRRQPVFHHGQHGRQQWGGQFLRQRKRHRRHHGQDGA